MQQTKYHRFGTVSSRKCCRCSKSCCCLAVMGVTAVLVIMFTVFVASFAYPLHASCKIDWKFKADCSTVNKAIVTQIKVWNSDENCKNGGEKCLYKLKSQSDTEIKATHETPAKHYVDDLTFTFKPAADGCNVNGYSTSETWYAVLDYGTNYCNLHNLITGAELDKDPMFKETTSDSQCTQYSSADCTKY